MGRCSESIMGYIPIVVFLLLPGNDRWDAIVRILYNEQLLSVHIEERVLFIGSSDIPQNGMSCLRTHPVQ